MAVGQRRRRLGMGDLLDVTSGMGPRRVEISGVPQINIT